MVEEAGPIKKYSSILNLKLSEDKTPKITGAIVKSWGPK